MNADPKPVKATVPRLPILSVSTQMETPPAFCLSYLGLLCPSKWTSLVGQWFRLCAPNAGAPGLILGQGTKIPPCHMAAKKKTTSHSFSPQ